MTPLPQDFLNLSLSPKRTGGFNERLNNSGGIDLLGVSETSSSEHRVSDYSSEIDIDPELAQIFRDVLFNHGYFPTPDDWVAINKVVLTKLDSTEVRDSISKYFESFAVKKHASYLVSHSQFDNILKLIIVVLDITFTKRDFTNVVKIIYFTQFFSTEISGEQKFIGQSLHELPLVRAEPFWVTVYVSCVQEANFSKYAQATEKWRVFVNLHFRNLKVLRMHFGKQQIANLINKALELLEIAQTPELRKKMTEIDNLQISDASKPIFVFKKPFVSLATNS